MPALTGAGPDADWHAVTEVEGLFEKVRIEGWKVNDRYSPAQER
jgi:hypothetical protein